LNALNNLSSSEDSLLDNQEESSNYTSFFSIQSHHSYIGSDTSSIPPDNIFVENLNLTESNPSLLEDTPDDQLSIIDTDDDVDQLFNYLEGPLDEISNEDDVTIQSTHSFTENTNHHCFDQMTRDEIASYYKIMSLLDKAGAPRICYNRLVALLKKLVKDDGFAVSTHWYTL